MVAVAATMQSTRTALERDDARPGFRDPRLTSLWERVRDGERIEGEKGASLFATDDLIGLGRLASERARQASGRRAFFVVNRHVNYSNVCVLACRFCDFARHRNDEGAYELTTDRILALIEPEIREVHIVGGHHPDWPFEHYVEMVEAIHTRFPEVQIKAFTAAEIDYFSRRFKRPVWQMLTELKAVGLSCLPGGGAEVFSKRLRKLLFPGKASAERWLEVHRVAHALGIPSNATLLYGHLETPEERIRHLVALRDLQDETGGFQAFIPLAYQPGGTRLVPRAASAVDDLKMTAVARLMLDNVPHIKAYWVMMGEATASIALNFGADDLDGTIGNEQIAHAAGASSAAGLTRQKMISMIRDAGRVPVERDALYRIVRCYD